MCAPDMRCRYARGDIRSSSSRRKLSNSVSRSGVASTSSLLAWKTRWPFRSTSTPRTSPMRHPGWPISFNPVGRRLHQGNAVALQHSNGIRESLEGFDLKSSQINGLQLLCGIWHNVSPFMPPVFRRWR